MLFNFFVVVKACKMLGINKALHKQAIAFRREYDTGFARLKY